MKNCLLYLELDYTETLNFIIPDKIHIFKKETEQAKIKFNLMVQSDLDDNVT